MCWVIPVTRVSMVIGWKPAGTRPDASDKFMTEATSMYWVSIRHYEAVAIGNWWYCFIYCTKWRSGQVLPTPHWLTTLKDRASQLIIKYKSGALVTQIHWHCKICKIENSWLPGDQLPGDHQQHLIEEAGQLEQWLQKSWENFAPSACPSIVCAISQHGATTSTRTLASALCIHCTWPSTRQVQIQCANFINMALWSPHLSIH